MTPEELTHALGGAWNDSTGKGFAQCPCHDDTNPSLEIKHGDVVSVVVICRAGCEQDLVIDTLKQMGHWESGEPLSEFEKKQIERELKEKKRRANKLRVKDAFRIWRKAKASGKHPEAYFKGRGLKCPPNAWLLPADDAGQFLSCRTDEKGRRIHLFRRVPVCVLPIMRGKKLQGVHCTMLSDDGSAKMGSNRESRRIQGLKQGGHIPLGPQDPSSPTFVAEGYENALAARKLSRMDANAVSAVDAGNFEHVELPDCAEIRIARDRGKVGREAAEALKARYETLKPVGIAVPPKGDWADCLLDKSLDRKQLRHLLQYMTLSDPTNTDDFEWAVPMGVFMNEKIPKATCILNPILRLPGRSFLTARSGHMKTRLALSIAYACATGTPLMDWTIDEPCRVLYIDAELDQATMQEWLGRLGPPSENLLILSDKRIASRGPDRRISMLTKDDRDFLSEMVAYYDPTIIMLDNYYELAPPESGQKKDPDAHWPVVKDWMARHTKMERRHGMLLHHDNKSGDQFGSSLKERDFDLWMQLKRQDNLSAEDNVAVELSFRKPRHLNPVQAATRILTVNTQGDVEWVRDDELSSRSGPASKNSKRDDNIREFYRQGKSMKYLADEFGLTKQRVSQIVVGVERGDNVVLFTRKERDE